MGILLLLLIATLACFVGWAAHVIEKWHRNHPPRSLPKKSAPRPQRPPEVNNAEEQRPASPQSKLEREPASITQTPSSSLEPTRIEERFDNWRGTGEDKYPPDWRLRSAAVRQRDGDRCQIAGCPSLCGIHVHHLESIKNGGSHALQNLVTLCEFHHALMPDHLEAIGESLDNTRFSAVPKGIRQNPVNPGCHTVKAHIQRRKSASLQDIRQILDLFSWSCPYCKNQDIEINARQEGSWANFNSYGQSLACDWRLVCQQNGCGRAWYFQGGLLEEVGLVLAKKVFRSSSKPSLSMYEDAWLEDFDFVDAPKCPRTDCLGHLLWRRNRRDGSHFLGCSEYFKTGCSGKH